MYRRWIVVLLVIIGATPALAQTQAVHLAPSRLFVAAYLLDADKVVDRLDRYLGELRAVGIRPNLASLLGLKSNQPKTPRLKDLLKRFGFEPARGMVLYNDSLTMPTLIVGISDNKRILRNLGRALGRRPKPLRNRPGFYQFTAFGTKFFLRFHKGYALVSPNVQNINSRFLKSTGESLLARFKRALNHVPHVGLYLNLQEIATSQPSIKSIARQIAAEQFFGIQLDRKHATVTWRMKSQPLLAGILKRLQLSKNQLITIQRGVSLLPSDPPFVLRIVTPLRQLHDVVRQFAGPKEVSKWLETQRSKWGIDILRDVINNWMGDVTLFVDRNGLLDIGAILTVSDSKRTQALLMQVLKVFRRHSPKTVRYARVKFGRNELITVKILLPQKNAIPLTFHYTVTSSHALVSTNLRQLKLMIRRGANPVVQASLVKHLSTRAYLTVYSDGVSHLLEILQSLLLWSKHLIGSLPGPALRFAANAGLAVSYILDVTDESTLSFWQQDRDLAARWQTNMVPRSIQPFAPELMLRDTPNCVLTSAPAAYFRALQYRYRGQTVFHRSCLLKIMQRFPKSPQARKARRFLRLLN